MEGPVVEGAEVAQAGEPGARAGASAARAGAPGPQGEVGAAPGEPSSGPAALGRSLDDLHMALLRAFQAQRAYFQADVARLGVGPGQPKLLVYLAVHGASSQRAAASYFGIDQGSVSRMFDALARAGLVTDVPGPDRRTKLRALTPRGERAARDWELACDREQEVALRGLTESERAQLVDLLRRVRANLGEARRPAVPDVAATDPGAPDAPQGGERHA